MIWSMVFGLCFLIELFWRRGYALWLAMIAGFNVFFLSSLDWKVPLCFFIIIGGVALIVWYLYEHRPIQYFERHSEERKARVYLHKTFTLSHAINNGSGRELIDDSFWYLQCDQDLPAGTLVKVNKTQGIFLSVTSVIDMS